MPPAAEVIGIGGPAGAVAIALGYYLRYLIQRRGAERTSESGIVETTNATLKIVRDQQAVMAGEVRTLREENTDLRSRLRLKDEQIDKIYDQNRDLSQIIEDLRDENGEMRRRLDAIDGGDTSTGSTHRTARTDRLRHPAITTDEDTTHEHTDGS